MPGVSNWTIMPGVSNWTIMPANPQGHLRIMNQRKGRGGIGVLW